jgi:CheY-like chemotaxis protein/HPt (histidine-containing phosphotransfer) domain-containing protein
MSPLAEGAAPGRVLVVDDNPVNRQVATGLLRRFGIDADTAEDGVEALDALRRQRYLLVLMDLQMPRLDGIEATRQIRAGGAGVLAPDVPVIALTANALPECRVQCFAVGFNDFLTKPVSARLLAEALERIAPGMTRCELPAAGKLAPPAVAGSLPGTNPGADPVLDRDGLLERSMDDPELAREVLDAFLKESLTLYVALARSLRAPDPQPSLAAAHSIRGAAANAGAVHVRDIAGFIEARARASDYDAAIAKLGELAAQVERFREHAVAELEAPRLRRSGVA